MYFLKKGLDLALDLITLAIGLLICLMAKTPSLAAGKTPITIVFYGQKVLQNMHVV